MTTTDTALVRRERDGDIAVLVLDNPPVNTSNARLRAELLDAVTSAVTDENTHAVVLIGAGKHFLSGSDLREFDTIPPEPQLPAVIEAIESCQRPVVAALSGTTLGGGFELALGCDARIALAGGVIGLPEIALGMIPGAGGTQRTLRLVSPSRVVELATTGLRLPVEQAHQEGLINEVVPADGLDGDLRAAAVQLARRLDGKRRLRDLPPLEEPPGTLEAAARAAIVSSGADPAVVAVVGAVLTGLSVPTDQALAFERGEMQRLRATPRAAELRERFLTRKRRA